MYNGKFEKAPVKRNRKRHSMKTGTLLFSLLLIVTLAIGGTLAWLTVNTAPVENTFTPALVDCEVSEKFSGITKKDVTVINTSDVDAYLRVKLVTYRIKEAQENPEHIGGTATIPSFTPGEGWVKSGEYYYYKYAVAPGAKPAHDLIGSDGIQLVAYNDADGGVQVIEVMAEAIQAQGVDSNGTKAVVLAWGVDPEKL